MCYKHVRRRARKGNSEEEERDGAGRGGAGDWGGAGEGRSEAQPEQERSRSEDTVGMRKGVERQNCQKKLGSGAEAETNPSTGGISPRPGKEERSQHGKEM